MSLITFVRSQLGHISSVKAVSEHIHTRTHFAISFIMSSTTVKTVFVSSAGTTDMRRFQLDNGAACPYEVLVSFIKSTYVVAFGIVGDRTTVTTTYVDDDGDECSISTDQELQEAVRLANGMGKPLKINVAFINAPSLSGDSSAVDNVRAPKSASSVAITTDTVSDLEEDKSVSLSLPSSSTSKSSPAAPDTESLPAMPVNVSTFKSTLQSQSNSFCPVDFAYFHSSPLILKADDPALHPAEVPLLDLESEWNALHKILRRLQIRFHRAVATINNLQSVVKFGCTVLHYSGHGTDDCGLAFENGTNSAEFGSIHFVSNEQLKGLMHAAQPTSAIKLVVVSACQGELAGQAFQLGANIPHVVAVRADSEIYDETAIAFLSTFYESLFGGATIQSAFDQARALISADPRKYTHEQDKFLLLPQHSDHNVRCFHNVPAGDCTDASPTPPPSNLPSNPTPYIVRFSDIQSIIGNLADPFRCQTLTLIGPRGIGKFTLANACARYLWERAVFDGFYFIDCKRLSNSSITISALCCEAMRLRHRDNTEDNIFWAFLKQNSMRKYLFVFRHAEAAYNSPQHSPQSLHLFLSRMVALAANTRHIVTSLIPLKKSHLQPSLLSLIGNENSVYDLKEYIDADLQWDLGVERTVEVRPLTPEQSYQLFSSMKPLHTHLIMQEKQDAFNVLPLTKHIPKRIMSAAQLWCKEVSISDLSPHIMQYSQREDSEYLRSIKSLVFYTPPSREWNIRRQRSTYIKRSTLMSALRSSLDHVRTEKLAIAALTGLGGVGKSTFALSYISQPPPAYQYKLRVWFDAESSTLLMDQYWRFGLEMGINIASAEVAVAAVKLWLQSTPDSYLIVYDNVSSYDEIKEYLPASGNGHLLITSRYRRWPDSVSIADVDVMTSDESVALIQQVSGRLDSAATEMTETAALVNELDRLPLALAQASAYIKATKCSIARYLQLFQAHQNMLLANKQLPEDSLARNPVATTWQITLQSIEEDEEKAALDKSQPPMARLMLTACSYLSPQRILPSLLIQWMQLACPYVQYPDLTFEGSKALLLRYSMLDADDKYISVHRLVQAVVRYEHASHCELQWFIDLLQAIKEEPRKENVVNVELHARIILSHSQSVLDYYDQFRDQSQPEILLISECLFTIARVTLLGLHPSTRRDMMERVIKIKEHHFGPHHSELVIPLINLSMAYGRLGDKIQYFELAKRAVRMTDEYSDAHEDRIAARRNFGVAQGSAGNLVAQKETLEETLAAQERQYGPDHVQVAFTLIALGNAYGSLKNPSKLVELVSRALVIEERVFGRDHYYLTNALGSLGMAYRDLNNAELQKDVLERALKIQQENFNCGNHIFSPDDLVSTLVPLANAYDRLNNAVKKKEVWERVVEIRVRQHGRDHHMVAGALVCLANAYGAMGDHEKRWELLVRVTREFHSNDDANAAALRQAVREEVIKLDQQRQLLRTQRLATTF